MPAQPLVRRLEGLSVVVQALGIGTDRRILELSGVSLRADVAAGETEREVSRLLWHEPDGNFSRRSIDQRRSLAIARRNFVLVLTRSNICREVHPMELLEGSVLRRSPRMLLWRGPRRDRRAEVQAIRQILRLSVGRRELDGKSGQLILLEHTIVETEGQQYISIAGIRRYSQSVVGNPIAGSRGHDNLLGNLSATTLKLQYAGPMVWNGRVAIPDFRAPCGFREILKMESN